MPGADLHRQLAFGRVDHDAAPKSLRVDQSCSVVSRKLIVTSVPAFGHYRFDTRRGPAKGHSARCVP